MSAPALVNGRFTEAWLQGAIVMISEVIIEHGEQYAPILDRLERELDTLKQQDDPISRARRHLAARRPLASRDPDARVAVETTGPLHLYDVELKVGGT